VSPIANSLRLASPEPTDFTTTDPSLQPDSYFTDAYFGGPGDYFLSDLEVLPPLGSHLAGGSTSESSPEPSSAVDLNGHTIYPPLHHDLRSQSAASMTPVTGSSSSSRSPSSSAMALPSSKTSPASISSTPFNSALPNPRVGSRIEDVSFPSLEALAEETDLTTAPLATMKRQRANGERSDVLSACWTSPLCPNHDKEGTPPNPATCGGGCAPFLFGDEPLPNATIDSSLLTKGAAQQDSAARNPSSTTAITAATTAEVSRPNLKRTESESSGTPSGRTFPTQNPDAAIKQETTSSPEQAENDEKQGKGRRRLPHNQVERKYRESLNTQLDSLRRVVPALQQSPRVCDGADIEDLPAPSKPSKAVVLASATAYIKQMEKEKKQLADENTLLRTRIKALQSLVKCEDCSLMQYVMDLKLHNQT
jgi:Helix-loop-helix DNA-binding domain